MHLSLKFIRTVFAVLSILFFGNLAANLVPDQPYAFLIGAFGGLIFAIGLFLTSSFFKELNIRTFNVAALGLLFGWFFAHSILLILADIPLDLPAYIYSSIKTAVYLFSCYLAVMLTAQSSDELNFCIPFFKFNSSERKKKDILLDPSLLSDQRLIDLARSGLLDHQLLIPNFALEELRGNAESGEEFVKNKAQSALDVFKKLESLEDLELRIIGHDYPEVKDVYGKLIRLARRMNANILTADISKIQQSELEELKVININLLSQALKPLTTAGEHIHIKIQRFGKEPRQGVGYLDDGTMVVVNGGAEYIGKTIKVVVLSIKPTSSGRMIFCNTMDIDPNVETEMESVPPDLESGHNTYYNT